MKSQEDILNIRILKREGYSERQIARKLGIHRKTVKKYLGEQDIRPRYHERKRAGILDRFLVIIRNWLGEDNYKGTWIYDKLVKLGYGGSYGAVKGLVRKIKGEEMEKAYIRFETEPGKQAQVDFGEFIIEHLDGSKEKLYVFAMILGYSRRIYVEFIKRCDLPTFLECHIRAFVFFGGVPREILYDRMRNVFIRKLAGNPEFTKDLVSLALHYGFKPVVAPPYAPWVKGKVERPFLFIRENFWRGYDYIGLEETNKDIRNWLTEKESRVHGTTHERVSDRFKREQGSLFFLNEVVFDTSCRTYRTVHKDCSVCFEGNRYVVPHRLVRKNKIHVLLRIKDNRIRIFYNEELIVTYQIPEGKGHLVDDCGFYEALKRDQEQNRLKYGPGKRKSMAKSTISPVKCKYEIGVEYRSLSEYNDCLKEAV